MATLIIGDFRAEQLCSSSALSNHVFITDPSAEYLWFKNNVIEQLPSYEIDRANVVIMLGFNDCVYSCIWDTFKLDAIASNYINAINALIKDYPDFNFYVCSVLPIDAGYPFSAHPDGLITLEALSAKITSFNSKLKNCNATFIDCYDYCTNTGFSTRDGVRYMNDACETLATFINSNLKPLSSGIAFTPRMTKPNVNKNHLEGDIYWLADTVSGGVNPFHSFDGYEDKATEVWDTLPNCTAYAWGRFYEISGSRPTIYTGNAEEWWGHTEDGYKRGQTPAVGAIMCWRKGNVGGSDGAGHVAIVERVNPDGSILTSESGWDVNATKYSPKYWWLKTRKKTSNYDRDGNGNWGSGADYYFQGFIYCPAVSPTSTSELYTENKYTDDLELMKPNARYIWQYLGSRGWTINAVAALCGNIQEESNFSPCLWQDMKKGSTIDASTGEHKLNKTALQGWGGGYGLVQWTPYTNFINWCTNGGTIGNANGTGKVLPFWHIDSQLYRIEEELRVASNGGGWIDGLSQWIAKDFEGNMSFKQFVASTSDPYKLAGTFAFCYERPHAALYGSEADKAALRRRRGNYATYWFNYLKSLPPLPPITLTFNYTSSLDAVEDLSPRIQALKVTSLSSTEAVLAFLSKNIKSASYKVNGGSSYTIKLEDRYTFLKLQSLTPNTKYTIEINAVGEDESKVTESIAISTKQSLPESIKKLELFKHDNVFLNNTFRLTLTPTDIDFGYWRNKLKKACGYELQLIINGNVKEKVSVSSIKSNFKLSDYFKYKVKLDDSLQFGIRTWVKDSNDEILYDNEHAKTSNILCELKNPVTAYLR